MASQAGRADDWEHDLVYWVPENRNAGKWSLKTLVQAITASIRGDSHGDLIYVKPEGQKGRFLIYWFRPKTFVPRLSYGNEREETLAVNAAERHTFAKCMEHTSLLDCFRSEPAAAGYWEQGLVWTNKCAKGHPNYYYKWLRRAWTQAHQHADVVYLSNLFEFEWKQTRSLQGHSVDTYRRSLHKIVCLIAQYRR